MQMNVHAGRLAVFPDAMRFCDDRCQLITGETLTWKTQLSTGNRDFAGGVRGHCCQEVTTMKLWTGLLFSQRDLLWRRT